jgi:hypothetical protein
MIVKFVSAAALLSVMALYLFASIPFTNYNFLQVQHFWWLPWLIRLRPLVFAAGAAGLAFTTGPLTPSLRPWRRRFLAASIGIAACMALTSIVPAVQSDQVAAALCAATLGIALAGCVLDAAAHAPAMIRVWDDMAPPAHAVTPAALAGAGVAFLYVTYAVVAGSPGTTLRPVELTAAAAMSLGLHVSLFLAATAIVASGRTLARRSRGASGEATVAAILLVIVGAVVIRRVILTALDLSDVVAVPLAASIAAVMVLLWLALRARRTTPPRPRARVIWAALVVAIGIAILPPFVRLADWGFTLQKTIALAVWAAVSVIATSRARLHRTVLAAGTAGIGIAALASMPVLGAAVRWQTTDRRLDLSLTLEQYATFDTSLRAVLDIARPLMTDRQFFNGLRRIGEATAAERASVVPLPLVDTIPPPASRPDIYMIVVDSLRPDYLSPYNPAVTFTPAIGAFGAESVVMRRAFTPYAGTGLSEPAIWTGGLIPRLMYPEPFEPLNNLNRLLAAGGFRRYVSVDQILGPIFGPHPDVVKLDAHIEHPEDKVEALKYELCGTLTEVADRLERERPDRPVFVYTQPQNVHIRAIDTGGPHLWVKRPDADTLFAPAAAAVGRLDGCFGRFISFLKSTGRYDNSIVVLTADHGDSYGEEGRWGHAFYVAPETLRIPLIMHVPPALLRDRHWDADRVAWLTDVTPTLFELLGARPVVRPGLTGRPLFVRNGEDAGSRQGVYLVQSSYSRIYGLMDDDARWLYTADANRDREEFYDLTAPGVAASAMSAGDRVRYQRRLMEALGRVNAQFAPEFKP